MTLRSGEKVSAASSSISAASVHGAGRTARNGRFRTNDVAVIDFTGGHHERRRLGSKLTGTGSSSCAAGQTIDGISSYDIGGTARCSSSFRTEHGERELSVERGRAHRHRAARQRGRDRTGHRRHRRHAGVAGASPCPANQPWTSTGHYRRSAARRSTFNATGEVQLSADATTSPRLDGANDRHARRPAPLPSAPPGALIGRIGNGAPFADRQPAPRPTPAAGVLFLGINDDDLSDNQGDFQVNISARAVGRKLESRTPADLASAASGRLCGLASRLFLCPPSRTTIERIPMADWKDTLNLPAPTSR